MIITKEMINGWVDYMINYRNYSENTYLSYKFDLEDFIKYIDTKRTDINRIEDLTIGDIRQWLGNANENHGKSARANARALSSIKNFLKYLYTMNNVAIDENIFEIRPPKYVRPLPKMISKDEIEFSQIIKLGDNENENKRWISLCDKALILLMYGSGLRISEALSVNFKNVIDRESMLITIIGKGGKMRVVPILPIVLDAIDEYMNACPWIEMDNYKKLDVIFFTKTGKIVSRNYFSNRIRDYATKYNLPYNISPHSFRHSFATHLIENDVSITEVQKLLGHSKLSTTELYTQVSNQLLKEMYYSSHPNAE
jgi:integrase/recombinase XerC